MKQDTMTASRYTHTAIALHWLIALLILGTIPLGMYMGDLHLSPLKLKLFSYHKWIGVTVFGLAVLRLAWRAYHPAPPLPGSMPAWQRNASHVVHVLLYVLIFVIPLSGWLMSSAKGVQTVYLGVLPLPDLIGKDKALGDLLQEVHESLADILIALLVLHVAAAIKHHRVDRDDVLTRMLPWAKARKGSS